VIGTLHLVNGEITAKGRVRQGIAWTGSHRRPIVRCSYAVAFGFGFLWLWNPIRLLSVRNADEVGLNLIPLAAGLALIAEALFLRRPKGSWRLVIKVVVIGVTLYGTLVGLVLAGFAAVQTTTVQTLSVGNRKVAIVEQTWWLFESCRELELQTGGGSLARFSHNTGCIGVSPSVALQASAGSSEIRLLNAQCEKVPPRVGPLIVRCLTDSAD
jgi:hypothetical protein